MLFCQRLDFFKVSHVKVWILRTLTTMSGSVLSSGLDLSCLLVWICLVSQFAETSKFSVIWRSAGQGNKQHIHSSAGRKPENNNSSLKSRKQSFHIDVNHPPVCQSLRVLQQFYLSYLFILKSWDNLFQDENCRELLIRFISNRQDSPKRQKEKQLKFLLEVGFLFIMLSLSKWGPDSAHHLVDMF